MKDIGINSLNGIGDFLNEMLLEINGKIKQTQWSNDEIKTKYGLRSSNQILNEGDVFYMNSCPDYSLLFYDYLNSKDANPKLIIQELFYNVLKRKVFHFAIQFDFKNLTSYVETIGFNKVSYGIGNYTGIRNNVENLRLITLEKKISADNNIIQSVDADLKDDLEYFRNKHISFLIKANTNSSYDAFIRKVGEPKLYLDKN